MYDRITWTQHPRTAWRRRLERARRPLGILGAVGILAAALLVVGVPPSLAESKARVQVCHLPPGNPTNWHTITVGESAVPTHLAHGDLLGSCDVHCDTLCDDGNTCTIDACNEGSGCLPKQPVDCDDGNACTTDSCNPSSGCHYAPVTCTASDLCHIAACNPTDGSCTETAVVCDPGDACDPTTGDCRPCACPFIYDPVCGTDGQTYDNACAAECAGVAVAYPGEC